MNLWMMIATFIDVLGLFWAESVVEMSMKKPLFDAEMF